MTQWLMCLPLKNEVVGLQLDTGKYQFDFLHFIYVLSQLLLDITSHRVTLFGRAQRPAMRQYQYRIHLASKFRHYDNHLRFWIAIIQ